MDMTPASLSGDRADALRLLRRSRHDRVQCADLGLTTRAARRTGTDVLAGQWYDPQGNYFDIVKKARVQGDNPRSAGPKRKCTAELSAARSRWKSTRL